MRSRPDPDPERVAYLARQIAERRSVYPGAANVRPERTEYEPCHCPDELDDGLYCGGCEEYGVAMGEWQAVEDYRERRALLEEEHEENRYGD
jgi:hypothetical protein